MREDFNKLMVERERFGHEKKFHDVRNAKGNKGIADDDIGGKESIHRRRRNTTIRRKQFNENLNPLKGYLRGRINKPWDKTYSEIKSTFDARKVINNHILEHLFQYVELDIKIIDGKPCVPSSNGFQDVRDSYYSYYFVDPRDGLMKATNSAARRKKKEEERAARRTADMKKIHRVLDNGQHLFLIRDVWMLFTLAEDVTTYTYDMPASFEYPSYDTSPIYSKRLAAWNAMSKEEKEKIGVKRAHHSSVKNVMSSSDWIDPKLYNTDRDAWHKAYDAGMPYYMHAPRGMYWAKKETASHKFLKQVGIV